MGNIVTADMGRHPVYLWTLPMFHCNGWCFPWSISVKAGVHVCLRQVRAKTLYDLIAEHKVTHLCGAPIVMSILLNARESERQPLPHLVRFFTAAAPPPAAVLKAMREAGFEVTHLYGLTEVYGPAVVNDWKDEWNALGAEEQAHLKARQGVRYHALEALDVMHPDTMAPVPADGQTMGEVMFRGNVVMKGYLKNKSSTDKAFAGGWFHSGDLGVKHPDGYVQLRDRSKDIIISGGENISSIEVEDALFEHPGVQLAAVVARPDEKWGETPCAFVEMKPGADGDRGGAARLVPGAARPLQVPAHDRVRRHPEDLDRQGAEVRLARARQAARAAAGLTGMPAQPWPGYCRALLASSVASAAARFPGRGEDAPERVHGVRKTLKESRALARLFLPSVGEPARVTIAALAVVRRRVGRARDLDVMEGRLERLAPPPEIAGAARRGDRARARRRQTRPHRLRHRRLARPAQRDRQASRRLGPRRKSATTTSRKRSRAPIDRGFAAAVSRSRAAIRRRCTPCGRASSTCATSSRLCLPPGPRRSTRSPKN